MFSLFRSFSLFDLFRRQQGRRSDAPRVTVSETGQVTVTCLTSPAPRVVVSSTGAVTVTCDLGDVSSPATPSILLLESGDALLLESGDQILLEVA